MYRRKDKSLCQTKHNEIKKKSRKSINALNNKAKEIAKKYGMKSYRKVKIKVSKSYGAELN